MVRIKNQTKKEKANLFPGLTDGFPSLQSLPRHKLQIKDEFTRILPVFGAEYNQVAFITKLTCLSAPPLDCDHLHRHQETEQVGETP